jgi:hypothetical protein
MADKTPWPITPATRHPYLRMPLFDVDMTPALIDAANAADYMTCVVLNPTLKPKIGTVEPAAAIEKVHALAIDYVDAHWGLGDLNGVTQAVRSLRTRRIDSILSSTARESDLGLVYLTDQLAKEAVRRGLPPSTVKDIVFGAREGISGGAILPSLCNLLYHVGKTRGAKAWRHFKRWVLTVCLCLLKAIVILPDEDIRKLMRVMIIGCMLAATINLIVDLLGDLDAGEEQ